jgi:hypothetical protein
MTSKTKRFLKGWHSVAGDLLMPDSKYDASSGRYSPRARLL